MKLLFLELMKQCKMEVKRQFVRETNYVGHAEEKDNKENGVSLFLTRN